MKKEHYERLQEMLDDLCSALSEGFPLFLTGKRKEANENREKIDKIKKDIEKYVEEENINFDKYKEMYDTAVHKWVVAHKWENVDRANIQRRFR